MAEEYYHGVTIDDEQWVASASKSYVSALVGIAHDQGCLPDLDRRMMEFFPELVDEIDDERKEQITIRQLLQMRSGYPWEEEDPEIWDVVMDGDYYGLIADAPLVSDPGEEFHYGNITPHILGIIVTRECGVDLHDFAEQHDDESWKYEKQAFGLVGPFIKDLPAG